MAERTDNLVLSHWHTLFEDFSTSTQEFYIAVTEAVRERTLPDIVVTRVLFSEGGIGTPEREYLRVRRARVAFDICSAPYGNGHFFSWWLARVPPRLGVLAVFAIFAVALFLVGILNGMLSWMLPSEGIIALVAHGLFPVVLFVFVLWMLGYCVHEGYLGDEEWVLSLPVVGWMYLRAFNPLTYFRLDTAMMFRDSIRTAVNEVINAVRHEKGLRLLGEDELQPEAREGRAAG